jgi:RimJ/RimL family protein N-acetyltransferase
MAYTWTFEHGGRVAWLDELYVVPERRSRGIGRAMVARALAAAREAGCRAVDLEVDADHERAEHLYARHGFRRLARTRWVIDLGQGRRDRKKSGGPTERKVPLDSVLGRFISGPRERKRP